MKNEGQSGSVREDRDEFYINFEWCLRCLANSTNPRITWQSLSERLSRSAWPVDMTMGDFLDDVNLCEKTTHCGWHHSLSLGILHCVSVDRRLNSSEHVCIHFVSVPMAVTNYFKILYYY